MTENNTKFCTHCGAKIPMTSSACPVCGLSLVTSGTQYVNTAQTAQPQPTIIINNVNTNTVIAGRYPKNKWVAFFLCLLFGVFGAHKFYEGKIFMGILYLLTLGLFTIGVVVDLIAILLKPNTYYPKG